MQNLAEQVRHATRHVCKPLYLTVSWMVAVSRNMTQRYHLTLFWMYLPVTVYFAARCYRIASDPLERTAGLCCMSMVVFYLIQAFGDMGVVSWSISTLIACAVAVTATLAPQVGAWPAGGRARPQGIVPPARPVAEGS